MKKIIMILALSAFVLTGCNNGSSKDDHASESKSTTQQTTEITQITTTDTQTTSVTVSQTTKERDTKTTTTTKNTIIETSTSNIEGITTTKSERSSSVLRTEKASEAKSSYQNDYSDEQEDIPEKDRTKNEGDIIYEPEESNDEPETNDNTAEEFRIVTEAPIELPFIPAG